MANLRAIRTRIKSVENTRQITKSMKMVAASKLRKTQAAFAALRAYADRSGEILKELTADWPRKNDPEGPDGAPSGAAREAAREAARGTGREPASETDGGTGVDVWIVPHAQIRTVCYVLMVGNRGLCGTYNQALLRYCENLINTSDKENYV